MQLIPAIDLLDGACVRLLHGDFKQCTQYGESALHLARSYFDAGAGLLHVVDLAASRDGEEADSTDLFRLLARAPQKVQTGGGVRGIGDVSARLEQGADRVIVGSLCVTEPGQFKQWLSIFGPERLVAALDVRLDESGLPWPRIFGWTEKSDRDLWSLLNEFTEAGLLHLLCTDISRDGALSGPNTGLYRQIVRKYPHLQLQASGGVGGLDDLLELKGTGASGAITGKALLDGLFTVEEALEILS